MHTVNYCTLHHVVTKALHWAASCVFKCVFIVFSPLYSLPLTWSNAFLCVCAAPPFLIAIMTNSSALLIWDNTPQALVQYQVTLTGVSTPNPVTAAFFETQTFPAQGTNIQINGLVAGSTYNFSVTAFGEAGPSPSVFVINTTLEGCKFALHRQALSMIMYALKLKLLNACDSIWF